MDSTATSALNVSISHLTIADGVAQSGGGLLNLGGDVTLTDVELVNNQSVPDADGNSFGGAVLNIGTASNLTVSDSTLAGNRATGFVDRQNRGRYVLAHD